MSEPAITTLYDLLIQRAQLALTKPALLDEAELARLNDDIEAAVRKPAEGERLIFDQEKLLARVCLRIAVSRALNDGEGLRTWSQIAGVLLPVAREHWSRALAGRRHTIATTDQDYARKR